METTTTAAAYRLFRLGCVLSDRVQSYFPELQRVALEMIAAQGGIFGWVAPSSKFLEVLEPVPEPSPVLPASPVS